MTAPTARALAGGALVALSVALLFSIGGDDDGPVTSWLVAARAIPAGVVLTESDLALAPMDLHDTTRSGAFGDATDVIGSVAMGPIAKGDLVTDSRIIDANDTNDAPARRLTIELPVADALGGEISVPQLVDVVAVTSESSRVAARDVAVLSVEEPETGGIGTTSEIRLSLALPGEAEALEIIDARREGSVVLIASTAGLPVAAGGNQ